MVGVDVMQQPLAAKASAGHGLRTKKMLCAKRAKRNDSKLRAS